MKITLDSGAFMPTRAHDTDAGLDLYAMNDGIVPAGGSCVFDTGVHVELPRFDYAHMEWVNSPLLGENIARHEPKETSIHTAGFLKSKSGLMCNHDITSDGLIDFPYRGSIHVKLFNHGTEDYEVKRGDKISQLVIVPILMPTLELVDELSETDRGTNGFGSTGR